MSATMTPLPILDRRLLHDQRPLPVCDCGARMRETDCGEIVCWACRGRAQLKAQRHLVALLRARGVAESDPRIGWGDDE